MSLAARNNHKPIYLIGFDLVGNLGKINNVYAGTENYRPRSEKETFWGNWLTQLEVIMREQFPRSKFIRCVDKEGFRPKEWSSLLNYSEINSEELKRNINTSSWKQNE